MAAKLFTNVRIFDGSGDGLFPGDVLVEGNRIKTVAKGNGGIAPNGADVIDGGGATLMPGLVEAHGHLTYSDCAALKELGEIPPEEHVFVTMHNAKLLLDSGFTSVYSAASSKPRTEIAVRDEIDAGRIPGPRFKAASPEITSTGGLGDERQLHMHHQSIEIVVDGVDAMRVAVRTMIREGVDSIKINISGDNLTRPGFGERVSFSEAEVAVAAEEAHDRGIWLSCHARADRAIRLALKYKFRTIYHCDYASDETIDLIEAAKDEIFLAPAIGIVYTSVHEAADWGIDAELARSSGMTRMLEQSCKVHNELRKRGVRVLPGGDYGFAWNPNGTNARDLEHFVNLFGYTPREALRAATKLGGQIMGMGDELGEVKDGYLADLLLIDGDPTEDVSIFQDRENILMIMKDGQFHKGPEPRRARSGQVAAE